MARGGSKGGISVARALRLSEGEWTQTIPTADLVVVVFPMVVQGLSMGLLARRAREPRAHLPPGGGAR